MSYQVKTIGKGKEWEQEVCADCGAEVEWEQCQDCENGYSYHDCGEDCCCCLNPEPNVICDTCNGKGGWWICLAHCHDKNEELK